MIRIRDIYQAMPELIENFPDQLVNCYDIDEPDHPSDIDILATWDKTAPASDQPTVVLCTEPNAHHAHVEFADLLYRRPRSVWAISQIHPTLHWQVPATIFLPGHLCATVRANDKTKQWTISDKPFTACALLGGWTLERSFLLHELIKANVLPQTLCNYRPRPNQWVPPEFQGLFIDYQSPELPELDDARFQARAYEQGGINTMTPVDFETRNHTWVSQIIPWKIYDSCWINLVSETAVNSFLLTEKITKPLLAGQPWIVYGCQHFLKHLRDLGFQTFNRWIDESYDDIGDHRDRARAVAQSLSSFADLSRESKMTMIQDMQPVLHHNRALTLDTRYWYTPLVKSMVDLVK